MMENVHASLRESGHSQHSARPWLRKTCHCPRGEWKLPFGGLYFPKCQALRALRTGMVPNSLHPQTRTVWIREALLQNHPKKGPISGPIASLKHKGSLPRSSCQLRLRPLFFGASFGLYPNLCYDNFVFVAQDSSCRSLWALSLPNVSHSGPEA